MILAKKNGWLIAVRVFRKTRTAINQPFFFARIMMLFSLNDLGFDVLHMPRQPPLPTHTHRVKSVLE